jgi:hypothetical protein
MRTTRFATALDNGAKREDVQRTVGHVDPTFRTSDLTLGIFCVFHFDQI